MVKGAFAVAVGTLTAPKWPMVATCVAAVVAIGAAVTSLLSDDRETIIVMGIAGYLVGCVVAVATASAHRALENKIRSNPMFRYEPVLGTVTRVAMIVAIAAGLVCAFSLARVLAQW